MRNYLWLQRDSSPGGGSTPVLWTRSRLEAGYTKGAVYSNFESKEDLFFAVYERRVDRVVADYERAVREAGAVGGSERLVAQAARRRGGEEDGWLAVFFEFWAHVVRRPELRERFAKIHDRALGPIVASFERLVKERRISLPVEARQYVVAVYAMALGLSLERLTQPEVVDVTLGAADGASVISGSRAP